MFKATAQACANIALIKYWGKRSQAFNIPATDSLSLTLDKLTTTSTIEFSDKFTADTLSLNDTPPIKDARLKMWLDIVRKKAACTQYASVSSTNHFPTASGLASSASAYASLTVAATHALRLNLSRQEQSDLARQGSASAARSLFGGLVLLPSGTDPQGKDSVAVAIDDCSDWDIAMVIAVINHGKMKSMSSRDAMNHCAKTSPLYQCWLDTTSSDIKQAKQAIAQRNLTNLGTIMEHNTFAMHGAAWASRPPVRYATPATIAVLDSVNELRKQNIHCYITMDAGPHVKILTTHKHIDAVETRLKTITGVTDIITSGVGKHAALV